MKDRSTHEVFGEYIDVYDMTQAVEDGATRPVYYESRVIKLKLDEETLKLIDTEYDIMANNADPDVIQKSKRELGQMEAILGNDQTIASLVDDILDHYENYRANLLTGKAMIVAYSRPIAMKIYKRILRLRPSWTEKVAVVMTESNKDPEEWREIIGNQRIIAGNAQFTGIAAGRGVGFTTGLLLLREGLGMRETPIRPHSWH